MTYFALTVNFVQFMLRMKESQEFGFIMTVRWVIHASALYSHTLSQTCWLI